MSELKDRVMQVILAEADVKKGFIPDHAKNKFSDNSGNLKCPFCNQKLEPIGTSGQFQCGTWDCDASFNFIATRDVWEYIDRTRKTLDVAKEGLKSAHDYYEYCIQRDKDYDSDDINWDCTALNMDNDISEALEQITALEQKDVK